MESESHIEETLRAAAERLAGKGLIFPGDMLSWRIPERTAIACFVRDGNDGAAGTVTWLAPDPQSADLHARLHASRLDTGAILTGHQPWASALSRLGRSMPAIFDEQVRHLGLKVEVSENRLAGSSPVLAAGGANAFVADGTVLCLGMTLDRLLLNAELLEKCAKAFVLASATGEKVRTIPRLVRFIANRRLMRDEKQAAASHLSGRRAVLKAGYT